jgi:serine/threonine protein kinase
MKLEAGMRVQDHILVERLGSGAFGEVWKVAHAHLPRTAAIKFATSEKAVDALLREGVPQFGLDHPGIVKVLDANLSAVPPFVVLEYVEGRSLREVLRERGRLEVPDAASIFRQLAAAIAYAHEKGVIHGDVKPENVIVAGTIGADLRAKLTDFQLGASATGARPFAPGAPGVRPSLETRGAFGTYRYLAPEQEAGEPLDGRADLFGLGVVLFEMLTGRLPQGRDLPSDLEPSISWWWDHIFSRCYTGRERRYPGARELLQDIAAAEKGPRWGDMPSQRTPALPAPRAACAEGERRALRAAEAVCARRRPTRGLSLAAAVVALLAVLVPFGMLTSMSSVERADAMRGARVVKWRPSRFVVRGDEGDIEAIAVSYLRVSNLLDRVGSQGEGIPVAVELAAIRRRAAERGYRIWDRVREGRKVAVIYREGDAAPVAEYSLDGAAGE